MKLIIIDDDHLVTSGLKTIIEMGSQEQADPIQVVGIGHSGLDALDLFRSTPCDLILMDIRMPEMNGLEAGKIILEESPQAKLIYLTTFQEDDYIVEALRIGSKGYLLKTDYPSLIPALQAVHQGQRVFGDEIIAKLPSYLDASSKTPSLEGLSETENQLVYWLAQGLNNKELADQLHFSEGTIRNYLSLILDKLQLRDRTQLVIHYYKHVK